MALAPGLDMPRQDNDNRRQWVVNARPEAARMKVLSSSKTGGNGKRPGD